MSKLSYLAIPQAHELLTSKQVSAVELTQYYLDRIEKVNPKIKAVLTVCGEQALAQAKEVDVKIAKGEEIGLLEGIPYTAKDMFLTKGIRTTAASKILESYIPPYSATVIEKLDSAGAILLAKVNQDEFAHGGSTENSAFEKTANPWNTDYVPGGSSGGSAAAVAADFGIFSLGTDTGGSIRQPAAFCGVTGLKPSYGMVSRYGVVAMASSFDCIGPLARSAEDANLVLACISGKDLRDSTTIDLEITPKVEVLDKKTRVRYLGASSVPEQIAQIGKVLIELGYDSELSPIKSQDKEFDNALSLAVYYILVPSEISSNLERYDGIRYGSRAKDVESLFETYTKTRGEFLGPEVKRRIMIGTYALSAGYYDAYYKKAMEVRSKIISNLKNMFEQADLLILPTSFDPAFKIDSKADHIEMYKADLLTVTANLSGFPAVSIPCGMDKTTGLPLGLQIMGRQGEDAKVLALAHQIQQVTDWHKKVEEIKL